MSEQLKRCSICKSPAEKMWDLEEELVRCTNRTCHNSLYSVYLNEWQERPIEDELRARITELEAENSRLATLLHDVLSQLEIATDIGNKRWVALNEIYTNGEKHNANWCKRKAEEALVK